MVDGFAHSVLLSVVPVILVEQAPSELLCLHEDWMATDLKYKSSTLQFANQQLSRRCNLYLSIPVL